jgi:hypothetical protein
MGQLVGSEGQPGNWEEPDFFLRRLETVRFQEKGWQERYDGRLSRNDLRERGGEIPLRYRLNFQNLRPGKPHYLFPILRA